ncbi:MAG: dockerin type I repeat-containing protein [Oscillospiraceae bacterium]|nr:dockerin type I repeat-containing protein [Oscillospiraceae bacterium]
MKNIKKNLLSVILVLTMVMTTFSLPVNALASNENFSVSYSVTTNNENEVVIVIKTQSNNSSQGITADLSFDSALEFKSYKNCIVGDVKNNELTFTMFYANSDLDNRPIELIFSLKNVENPKTNYYINLNITSFGGENQFPVEKIDSYEITANKPLMYLSETSSFRKNDLTVKKNGVKYTGFSFGSQTPSSLYNKKKDIIEIYDNNKVIGNVPVKIGLRGDVKTDGVIDVFDATYVAQYTSRKLELNNFQLFLADVNFDGNVDVFDAVLISRKTVNPDKSWEELMY